MGWPAGYKTWTSYKKWTMGSSPEVHSVVRSPWSTVPVIYRLVSNQVFRMAVTSYSIKETFN